MIDNFIRILKALKEQRLIEVRYIGPNEQLRTGKWYNPKPGSQLTFSDIIGPNSSFDPRFYEYRVATIRPYSGIEEFLEGMRNNGIRLKKKGFAELYTPCSIDNKGVTIKSLYTCSWSKLLSIFTWATGSPCGIVCPEN